MMQSYCLLFPQRTIGQPILSCQARIAVAAVAWQARLVWGSADFFQVLPTACSATLDENLQEDLGGVPGGWR